MKLELEVRYVLQQIRDDKKRQYYTYYTTDDIGEVFNTDNIKHAITFDSLKEANDKISFLNDIGYINEYMVYAFIPVYYPIHAYSDLYAYTKRD